jgi:P pilus assembly chaperone PapD
MAALLAGSAAFLNAFTFDPLSATFDAAGAGSVHSFRVRNEGATRIAVMVRVMTREYRDDGSELNEPAPEGYFVVFPSRFVMEGGENRMLKVQWKGGDPGQVERAFRIVAEQVPVSFEERKGSGIHMLFKYMGALYVRPSSPSPADIGVVYATGAAVDGARGIYLRLRNSGGTHAAMTDFKLSLATQSGRKLELPETAQEAVEGGNVLAGLERVFFIPYEKAEVGVSYDARIEFKPES